MAKTKTSASGTPGQIDILRILAEQPDGGLPVNALPITMDFLDYRACRQDGLLVEKPGRSGFLVAKITDRGRTLLAKAAS